MISYRWLEDYANRVAQNSVPFLAAFASIVLMVFGLIAIQSLRAAIANPAKSLRTE
jgi:hypothetical protein